LKPLLASLCVIVSVGTGFAQSTPWPPHDFAEYYSAARVIAEGGNPYDGERLLPIQRTVNDNPDQREATMLWTPPWTLPLYAPLGLLPPAAGQVMWAVLQAAMILLGSVLLWRIYGSGLPKWSWAVFAGVLITSGPIAWTFGYGQNTGFLVLGLGGYLYFRERDRPLLAGLLGALTAIKPHLLVAFALMLLLDARNKPGRRVILGGLVALCAGSLIATALRPTIFADFRSALDKPSDGTSTNVADWQLPLLSYHFRWAVDPTEFRLQFLPIAVVAFSYIVVRLAYRRIGTIADELARVVLLSVLAAPYGGWTFDLVVLLVVSLHGFAFALKSKRTAAIVVAAFGHLIILRYAARIGLLHEGWWLAPAVGVWWMLVTTLSKEKTA